MKSKVLDAQMELLHRNETLSIENFKNKLCKDMKKLNLQHLL